MIHSEGLAVEVRGEQRLRNFRLQSSLRHFSKTTLISVIGVLRRYVGVSFKTLV
jgi:hypothetical protein